MADERHYAVIDPYHRRLKIEMNGEIIAESTNAKILKEVGKGVYDPVFYIPREDVIMKLESESERQSHCPIKGDASYWNITGNPTENYFAWSYEKPLPRSKKLKSHIAFNMDYVTLISEPLD